MFSFFLWEKLYGAGFLSEQDEEGVEQKAMCWTGFGMGRIQSDNSDIFSTASHIDYYSY